MAPDDVEDTSSTLPEHDAVPGPGFDPGSLGWSDERAERFAELGLPPLVPARVIIRHGEELILAGHGGEAHASLGGRIHHLAATSDELPVVGDWVAVEPGSSMIHSVLERGGTLSRVRGSGEVQLWAANVDLAVILVPADMDVSATLLRRLQTACLAGGVQAMIAVTKSDLGDPAPTVQALAGELPGIESLPVSTVTGLGLDELTARIGAGRTAVFIGRSGVGKSTLANAMTGTDTRATGAMRRDGAGRHTSSDAMLLSGRRGILLIDMPGMRVIVPPGGEDAVIAVFTDIEALAMGCRFADCSHEHEPGCAVIAAVEEGELEPERLAIYRREVHEAQAAEKRTDARAAAAAGRAAGKMRNEARRAREERGGNEG